MDTRAWVRITAAVGMVLCFAATGAAQSRVAYVPGEEGRAAVGSALQAPAKLSVENVALAEALVKLSEASGVIISFSPSLIGREGRLVSCGYDQVTVKDALTELLKGTAFRYSEFKGQVIIFRDPVDSGSQGTWGSIDGFRLATALNPDVLIHEARRGIDLDVAVPGGPRARAAARRGRAGGMIRGRVIDAATGGPLAVVQVSVMGTAFSTLTRENGEYVLTGVPAGLYTVQANRLGYAGASQENVRVRDDDVSQIDFALRVSALVLDELVVTGLVDPTSARRAAFTIGRVSGDALQVPTPNAISSIQGRIASASIITPAQPGAGINIVLRTPTSINRSNTPLFVVDGVVLASTFGRSSTDLSSLDIESIEVVKGAAAASLYGSRAAAGVINIRTRRGAGPGVQGTQVTVRSEIGVNQLARRISLARHHNYLTDAQGRYVDANGNTVAREDRVLRPVAERFLDVPYADPIYDHGRQFFDPGRFVTNSVTMGGSTESTNFFAAFGNHQIGGVVLDHGGYTRNDVRLNLDHSLAANLRFSFSGYHMRSDREHIPSETFFQLIQQAPDVDLLQPDPDGTKYIWAPDLLGVTPNPLYELVTSDDNEERVRTLNNIGLRWTPVGWFSLDGDLSYDRSDRTTRFYFPRGRNTNISSWQDGAVDRGNGLTTALNSSVSAQLRGSWQDLSARLTLRALQEREDYEFVSTRARGLAVEGVPDLDAGTIALISNSTQEIAARGFFAMTNFDYRGRYIGDLLVRRDGSSLFGAEERWHTYYRASAAWRMAEEPWWRFDALDEFKLRYSIGTAGGRPNFGDRFETYSFTDAGGVTKSTLGNRFLKPERTTEQEFGIDAIIGNRFSVQLSHARQKTEDQLIAVPLPAAFGFSSQWQNAGTVEGTTWEATFEAAVVERSNLRWSLGLVADRSRHEITEFDRRCFRTGPASTFFRCAGETLGTMYGTRFLTALSELPGAVPANQFQVNDDGLVVWVGEGGDWRNHQWGASTSIGGVTYGWGLPILQLDESGSSAVVRIGDSNPDFNWGLSSNLRYGNVSVFGLVNAQVGGDIYNRTKQRMYQYFRSGDTDQAGKPEDRKKTTDYYSVLYAANLINQWFVEPAGYVKLREATIRYQVPPALLDRLARTGTSQLALFATGRNLLTWTDYSGYDPDAGTPLARIDDFVYPQFRTLTTGLEIRF
jgi:TonB-linked SusC/RagA family outer membrane protein